jgi:hypothetical protein
MFDWAAVTVSEEDIILACLLLSALARSDLAHVRLGGQPSIASGRHEPVDRPPLNVVGWPFPHLGLFRHGRETLCQPTKVEKLPGQISSKIGRCAPAGGFSQRLYLPRRRGRGPPELAAHARSERLRQTPPVRPRYAQGEATPLCLGQGGRTWRAAGAMGQVGHSPAAPEGRAASARAPPPRSFGFVFRPLFSKGLPLFDPPAGRGQRLCGGFR